MRLRYMFPGIMTKATKKTPRIALRVKPSSNSVGVSRRSRYSSTSRLALFLRPSMLGSRAAQADTASAGAPASSSCPWLR